MVQEISKGWLTEGEARLLGALLKTLRRGMDIS
jgi:hypothetical protein